MVKCQQSLNMFTEAKNLLKSVSNDFYTPSYLTNTDYLKCVLYLLKETN